MRRHLLAALALLLGAPAAAAAPPAAAEPELDSVAKTLADPARQQAMARAAGAMAQVLLDLPLAPIIGPLAEAAGEDPRKVDRDATLRKMAPGAADAPRQIERHLPRAMGAMAGMSGAIAALLPQLREAAERMRDALPAERP
ncbi:hypothetical protein [Qipengyuania sediminis]|uniref:hypothetical protein n=1 Tax=Qipengyuania sediminis TaxID=1532023 RepID=UPI0010594464|nr:hypothetical protein [Qipengyuania sediminis]